MQVSNKKVSSGYGVNADGNIPVDPKQLLAAAKQKIANDTSLPLMIRQRAGRLTLAAYTLARYVTSEVGTSSIGESIAVLQDAVNQAIRRGHNDVVRLLVYSSNTNGGWYGPINRGKTAPFNRWASTSSDPTVRAIVLAQDVLDGVIPRDFNKGGADQANLTKYDNPNATIRRLAGEGLYWTGDLPGVDHRRSMSFAPVPFITATESTYLVDRAIRALNTPAPTWSKFPYCDGSPQPHHGKLIATATIAFGVGVGTLLWLTRRKATPTAVL
jgi:hypothetical protein